MHTRLAHIADERCIKMCHCLGLFIVTDRHLYFVEQLPCIVLQRAGRRLCCCQWLFIHRAVPNERTVACLVMIVMRTTVLVVNVYRRRRHAAGA